MRAVTPPPITLDSLEADHAKTEAECTKLYAELKDAQERRARLSAMIDAFKAGQKSVDPPKVWNTTRTPSIHDSSGRALNSKYPEDDGRIGDDDMPGQN